MQRYCINEDIRLKKLPVRYSKKLVDKIEDVNFYNQFEVENLNQWISSLKGIISWLSNPIIAWDNCNEFIHYDDGKTYISRYGILFKILTNKDKRGIERNFIYVLDITLNLQNYNLKVPPYLQENKRIIPITESYIRHIVRKILRQYLQL